MSESLLDFYRRHRISPVRQNIQDLRAHFARRSALYRQLGILPGFMRGRTALEIGPGSGFNSVYTASLEPSRYVLVEANPRGIDDIRQLFSHYPTLDGTIEIVSASVDDYASSTRFDFVFCEGMLGLAGVPDPGQLLRTVADHTAPGGVLVITCIDAVSCCGETLRRLVAQRLIDPAADLDERVQRLVPAFGPHLTSLAGMNRRHDDWIIDNLLNPASIGPLLSIPDAFVVLQADFDVFGASPRFLTDWRWYKAIDGMRGGFNELAVEEYWSNVHNLLDYRRLSAPRDHVENRRLHDNCVTVRNLVRQYESTRNMKILDLIAGELDKIVATVATFSPDTSHALAEVRDLVARPSIDAAAVATSCGFAPWFGRGQQYLSFSRQPEGRDVTHDRRDG